MTKEQISKAIWDAARERIGRDAVSKVMWAEGGQHRNYIQAEALVLASASDRKQLDAISVESAIIVRLHHSR